MVQDGYRLVLATYEVRYDGPGQLAPAEELWLTGESDRTYFPDIAEGLVDDPMKHIDPLQGGETARFRSAFLVPRGGVRDLPPRRGDLQRRSQDPVLRDPVQAGRGATAPRGLA